MKKIIYILFSCAIFVTVSLAQTTYDSTMPHVDQNILKLCKSLTKDIFTQNGVAYLQPMVEVINATSNSRFYSGAYVPKEVKKPYFRLSINGMMGFTRKDMKTYKPIFPTDSFDLNKLSKYMTYDFFTKKVTILDTSGLILYAFKLVVGDGIAKDSIKIPATEPTILGGKATPIMLDSNTLRFLMHNYAPGGLNIYNLILASAPGMALKLDSAMGRIPNAFFMPDGVSINTILTGIPQIEIGSLFGTEALIRVIPLIDMGPNIGNFAFWGFGLKHSISQYFPERYFDLAVQAVYQGTYLKNNVGLTNSELSAKGTFWNFNLQFSKDVNIFSEQSSLQNIKKEDYDADFTVYGGISYGMLKVHSDYLYYLPLSIQMQIGLLPPSDSLPPEQKLNPKPRPGYPGDKAPQSTTVDLKSNNFIFNIGLVKEFKGFSIFLDYNISKFNIFTGGIAYQF
ncbi:MAG: hypothetical protein NT007_10340 [Candidatus Kapabacteria bacterium]|nr:hypothetical protein [Candidatus Kapabacteria bacterium]